MAIMTVQQLAECREGIRKQGVLINAVKGVHNAALQAVEDFFESRRGQISTAIDTATAPVVLTVAQKKALIAEWANFKFKTEKG